MSANDRQVGGSHYAAGVQHWDVVGAVYGPGYYAACASKYVTRWRKKNGLEDLEKAVHFLDKLIEYVQGDLYWPLRIDYALTQRFLDANQLSELESEFCRILFNAPNDLEALLRARDILLKLIDEAKSIPKDNVQSGVAKVTKALGNCDFRTSLTILIGCAGHVLAAMSGGRPRVIQDEGTSIAEAIKTSALQKIMRDSDLRRAAKQKEENS